MSKNKKSVLIGVGAVIALSLGLYFYHPAVAICPDDFKTSEEATAAMVAWENKFFDEHPDGSLSDMAGARHQFYIDNHCTAALERYEQAKAGKADPETMKRVDGVIRDVMSTSTP